MKYKVIFRDCWNGKIHEEECLTLECLQVYMYNHLRDDCICISLEVIK